MKFFLNDITGAAFAYSYKKLNANYAGACLRISRSNDFAETDIGFGADGYMDIAAVESFLPSIGTTVYARVVRWYDQSGNGSDATQTNYTRQPYVAFRSSLNVFTVYGLNSSTAVPQGILFNGSTFLDAPSVYSQAGGFTTLYHFQSPQTTVERVFFNLSNATEKFAHQQANGGTANQLSSQHVNSAATFSDTASITFFAYGDYAITDYLTAGPTAQNAYLQGTLMTGTVTSRNVYNTNVLGARNSTSYYAFGNMHTFIAYDTDKYADVSEINSYFIGIRPGIWYLLGQDIDTAPATTGSPTAGVIKNLSASPITTGAPFVGSPGLGITIGLTASGITTGLPALGNPTLYLGTFNIGTRAISTFTSELGREWQILIIEDGHSGPSLNQFEVAAPGFTLQYESPNDDLITPIKASKCSMEMIINQTDTALQQLITDISQADDGKFFIYVREDKDLNGSYEPYWWGPIYTDMIKEPDTWPSVIKLVATDNLGRLKDIDYESGGLPITGNKRFTEIIAEILEAGGNGSAIVTHDYIKFSTEWWHNQMGASINNEPMFLSAIRAENYWERDSDTGKYVSPSSYDVLKSILNDWNARIIMTDGYYVIEQATTYSAVNRQEYITDDQGQVTGNALRNTTAQVDQTNIIQLAQGSQDWNKALKEVKRNYLHRYASNILSPQEDYWEATNSATFPYAAVAMNFATAGTNKSLQIDGQMELVITNNTGSDYTWSTNHVMVSMRIEISNGTTTYLLDKSIWDDESQAQWVTSSGGRYDAAIPIGKLADGDQYRKIVNFTVKTPSWTEENMLGTLFYVYYGNTPAIYVALNASGNAMVSANKQDFNIDPYDAAFSGDTVLQGRTKFVFIGLTGGDQNQDGEEIEYIATNSSGTGVNEYEYEQDSKIGSFFKSQIEPGLIRVWDGSQYVTDVGEWEFAAIAGAKDFNNLAVQERLRMNKEPRDRKYVTIFGDINAYDHLAYGTGPSTERYVFLGGNFIANNDRWQGVWEKITRATTGVSGTGSSLPSPTGISGIATSPTLPSTPAVAGLTSGLNGQNALATANGTIPKNTSISNIPITPFWKSGVINSGDTFSVLDSSGQVQNFTATADVKSGDTSISVSSTTTSIPIGPGSTISYNAQQQSQYITNLANIPTIVTTSISSLLVTSGSVTGSGFYYQQNHNGLVFVNIQFAVSGVSSPTGSVQLQSLNWPIPQAGYRFSYYVDTLVTLSDGIKPMISQASGNLRLFDETLSGLDGSEIQTGTKIFATIVYPDSI